MATKLISLSVYDVDLMVWDELVEIAKTKSFTPDKVNRSTVLRDLLLNAKKEMNKMKTEANK